MPKPRRPRSDSAAGVVRTAQGARRTIEPPSFCPLRPQDLPFWAATIACRASDEWENQGDLVLAAQLARCQADIEDETVALRDEGSVLDGRPNPRGRIVAELTKMQLSLLRGLRIAGSPTGAVRDLQHRRAAESKARRALDDDDELLAGRD